jgi:flagellar motor component MotA
MVRYLIALVILSGGIVLGLFLNGVDNAFIFLDLSGFFIVVLFPFLYISTLWSFKKMALAFSIPFKKQNTQDDLTGALAFFQKYGQITWIMGLVAAIFGVIRMFAYLDDKATIGPSVALAIVSLLYSGLINVLVIIPFTLIIKKQQAHGD